MSDTLGRILSLEVPIIVQLGERSMRLGDVVSLIPGAIIELPKAADEELDLLVNNKRIGSGSAVKVGENFGLKVNYIGDVKDRIRALGDVPAQKEPAAAPEATEEEENLTAVAAQMLAGQV